MPVWGLWVPYNRGSLFHRRARSKSVWKSENALMRAAGLHYGVLWALGRSLSRTVYFLIPTYPPRLKYCMPIHYDTIEGQWAKHKRKSHLLFSFLVKIVLFFCILSAGFYCCHWNLYANLENKCFNPNNWNQRVVIVYCLEMDGRTFCQNQRKLISCWHAKTRYSDCIYVVFKSCIYFIVWSCF